jgi:hypothetical protein
VLAAPLLAALAAADALVVWNPNGARPCALPRGTELLKGTLLDDSQWRELMR